MLLVMLGIVLSIVAIVLYVCVGINAVFALVCCVVVPAIAIIVVAEVLKKSS